MPKYQVQHEFDTDPTYIVETGTDNEVVTFEPNLPWQLRLRLANMVKDELEKGDEDE